jgi:vacuolar-type H+-ATPase subunit H
MLLEAAGTHVSEVISETKEEGGDEIRTKIITDAKKMLKDYQTIAGIFKKHGV